MTGFEPLTDSIASALALPLVVLACALISCISLTYVRLDERDGALHNGVRATLMVIVGGPIRAHRRRLASVRDPR